ncbi:peptidoglycan-recognition protein SB2-like isoform X2 [Macrosteles quadrilineatus]|uniref:peptidoglycan-recognition protein SB2-like isoform X2 n=1 Tax=Macrosteles quadrilineatus TaxID=74068 RepID=UPI0023E19599|nr:peptidoglycan-recognition protein SB2-like isoform X2 [Macrosteles quadrilineatus]
MVRSAGRGRKPQWRAVIPELLKHPPKSNIPPPLEMITRAEWSAVPWMHMDSDIRLKFPIMHLRHTFTDTDECKNPEECIPFLQQLQKDSQEKGFPDLIFLIGSDGMLYEGRGFDWKCTVFDDPWVDSKGESLNIAYIGRFHSKLDNWFGGKNKKNK